MWTQKWHFYCQLRSRRCEMLSFVLKDQMKKVPPLGGGIDLCGSSSCERGLRSLLNTEGILTLPVFLLTDESLIWMWSASIAWQCRVLLSLSIIVKSKLCFWVFYRDVVVSDGTGSLISNGLKLFLSGTCWFHLFIQLCNICQIQPQMFGVGQGCVIAPSLFGIYLSTLLHHTFLPPHGIVLHTRHDRNLFTLACLRTKRKTNNVLIQVMFANDMAFYTQSVPKLQDMCNAFSTLCDLFGWRISTKKTVMLATNGPPTCIWINRELFMLVNQLCYLGFMIAMTVALNTEVSSLISKAANIFGKLRSCVWDNKYQTICTKVKIYEICLLSSVLYGSETWPPNAITACKLNSFLMCSLRKLLHIT